MRCNAWTLKEIRQQASERLSADFGIETKPHRLKLANLSASI